MLNKKHLLYIAASCAIPLSTLAIAADNGDHSDATTKFSVEVEGECGVSSQNEGTLAIGDNYDNGSSADLMINNNQYASVDLEFHKLDTSNGVNDDLLYFKLDGAGIDPSEKSASDWDKERVQISFAEDETVSVWARTSQYLPDGQNTVEVTWRLHCHGDAAKIQ
ncbi:hypothetical protein [Vibrio rarus]|uniref:hypothetical protein n=1 Tax=Vibrio rarus TaxID=413403 RepID=UPI0021C29F87|nr:hypothetical protein [Vibrio rarus]